MAEPVLHWKRRAVPWVFIVLAAACLVIDEPEVGVILIAIGWIASSDNQQATIAIATARKLDAMHDDIRRRPW